MSIPLNRMEIAIIILCSLHLASTAPVQDTVKRPGRVPRMQGCFYNAAHFENGEQIITNEPCLNCTCVDSTLMCYLRVCPFLKPVGEECIEEKSKGDCCPKIWCPEVVKEKDCDNPKHEGKHDHPGCYLDNKYYPDGAMLPHDPKKPCEVCYCIRNSTSCVIQECELKVDGCTPVYKEGQCCPCRYNCSYDELTTIAPPGVTVQDLSEGCVLSDGRFIEDGEAVNSTNPCEHCYCMRNEVVCAIQECQAPGANCRPLAPKSGQCCPDRYECPSGGIISSSPAMSFSTVFTTGDSTTPKTSVKGYGIKTSSQKGIGIKGGASKSSSPLKPAGVKGVFSEPHSSIKSSTPSSSTVSVSIDASIDHSKESIYDAIEDATMYELETMKTETSTFGFYEASSKTPEVIITKDQSDTTVTSSHSVTQEIYAESTSQQPTTTENLIFVTETNSSSKVSEPFKVVSNSHVESTVTHFEESTVTHFEESTSKTPEKPVVTEGISKVTTATSVTSEENAKISAFGTKSTKLQGVKSGLKKEADSKEIGSKTVSGIKGQPLEKETDTASESPKFGVKSVGLENERVKGGHQITTSVYDKAGITKQTSTIDSLSLFVESSNAQFVEPSNAKNDGQLLLVASQDETAEVTLDAHSLPMGILTKGGNRSVVAQITGIFRPSISQKTKIRQQNKTDAPEKTAEIKNVGIKSPQATGFGVKDQPIYPPRERPMLPIGAIPGEHKIPTSSKNRPAVVAIPGEGGCRVGKIMYRNGQPMPSFNACKMNCQCINSVVYCDDIVCEIPSDSQNCVRIKIPGECCPKYLCGSTSIQPTQSTTTSKSAITKPSTQFKEEITQEPKPTMAELSEDILFSEKFSSDNNQTITESILTTQSHTNRSSLSDTSVPPKVITTTTGPTLFSTISTLFTEKKTEEPKSTMSAFTEEEILVKKTHTYDYEALVTESGLITQSQTDQSNLRDVSKSSEVEPIIARDTSPTTPPTPYTEEKAEEAKSTMSEFTKEDISLNKMHTSDYETSVTESSLTTQPKTEQSNLSDMSQSSEVEPITVRETFITTQPTLYTEEGTEELKSTMSEFTKENLLKQTHTSDYEQSVTENIVTNLSPKDQSSLSDIYISSEAESTIIDKTFITTPSTRFVEENTNGPKSTTVEFTTEDILFKEKHTSGYEAPVTESVLTTKSQTDQSSIRDTSLPSKIKSTTEDSVTISSLQLTEKTDSHEAETQTTLTSSTSDNSEKTYSESTKEFSSQTTFSSKEDFITEKNASSEINEMFDLPISTALSEHFHDVTTHHTLTSTSFKVKESASDKTKTASEYFSPTATSKIEETTDVPKKQEDGIQLITASAPPFSSDKDLFHSETTTASLMSQTLTIKNSAAFTEYEITTAEDKFSSVQGSDSLKETTILLEEITETNPSTTNLTTQKTNTDIIRDKEKYFPTHSATDITTKLLQEVSTSAQKIEYTETDTSHTEVILQKVTVHPIEAEHVHSFTTPGSVGIETTTNRINTNEISNATKTDFLDKTTTKHFPLHEITTEMEGSTYETKYNKLTSPFYSTTSSKITKEYSYSDEFTDMITSDASEATEFLSIITTKNGETEDKSTPSALSTLSNEEHVSKTTVIPVSIKNISEEISEITENDSSLSPTSDISSEIIHGHSIKNIESADNESTFINEIERDSVSNVISGETQQSFIPSSITELSEQLLSQTAQPSSATSTAKYSEMTEQYSENTEFPKETTISSHEIFESLNNLKTETETYPVKLETSKSVTPSISKEIMQGKSTLASITQTSTESSETAYAEVTKLYSEKAGSSQEITVSSEFSEITSGEDSEYSTPSSFHAESTIKDAIPITTKTTQPTSTYPDKIPTDEAIYKDVKSSTYDSSLEASLHENDNSSTITYTEESSSLSQSVESEEQINVNLTTTLLSEYPTTSHAYSSSTENDKISKEKASELSEHSKTTVSTFNEKAETSGPFQKLNTALTEKSPGISIADRDQTLYPATSTVEIELDSTNFIITSENHEINDTLKLEDSTDSTDQQDLKVMILELDKKFNDYINPEKQTEKDTGSSISESVFDPVTKISTIGKDETRQTSTEDIHTTFGGTTKTDSLQSGKSEFASTTMPVSWSDEINFHETSTPHDTVIQTETVPMASIKGPENLVLHTETKKPVSSQTTATYLTTLNKVTNFTVSVDGHDSDSSKYTTSSFEIETTSPDPSTLKFTESIVSEIVFVDPITKIPPLLESTTTTKTEATAETSKLNKTELEITKTTFVSSESENAGKTVSYTTDSNLKETESTAVDVTTRDNSDTAITAKGFHVAEESTQTPDNNISLGSSTFGNDFGSSDTEEYSSELSEINQHTKTDSGSQELATPLKSISSQEPLAGNIEFGTVANDFEKPLSLNTNDLETKSTTIENNEEATTHLFQVQVTVDDLAYSHVDQFTIRYDNFDSTQVSLNGDTYTTYKKTEDKVSEVTEDSIDKWIEVKMSTQDAEISSTTSPENFRTVTTDKSNTIYYAPSSISENTGSSQIFDRTHISFVTETSEITTQHNEKDKTVEVTQPRIEESSSDFMIGPESTTHSSNTEISYVTSTSKETSELFEFSQNKTQGTVIENTEKSTDLPVTFIKHTYNNSADIGASSSSGSVISTDNSYMFTPTETTDTKKVSSTGIVVETETHQVTTSILSEESSASAFDPIQTQKDNSSLFAEITTITTSAHNATITEISDVKPTEFSLITDASESTSIPMSLPVLLTSKKEDESTVSDNAVTTTVSSEIVSNESVETQTVETENYLLRKTTENPFSTPKTQKMFPTSVSEETTHTFETTQNIKLSTVFEKDTGSETYFPTEMQENLLTVSTLQSTYTSKVTDTSTENNERITTFTKPDIILSSVDILPEIISEKSNQSKDHESYVPPSKTTVQVLETSQAISNKENLSTFIKPDGTVTSDAESRPTFTESSTHFPIEKYEQALNEIVSTTLRNQPETTNYPSEFLQKTTVKDKLPESTETQKFGDSEHIQTFTTTTNVGIEDIKNIEISASTVIETKKSSVELSTKATETTSHSAKTDDYTSFVTDIPVLEHNTSQSLAIQDIKKVETDFTSTDQTNEIPLSFFSPTPSHDTPPATTDHSKNESEDSTSKTATSAAELLGETMVNTEKILSTSIIPETITEVFQSTKIGITREIFDSESSTIPTDLKGESVVIMENSTEEDKSSDMTDTENKTTTSTIEQTKEESTKSTSDSIKGLSVVTASSIATSTTYITDELNLSQDITIMVESNISKEAPPTFTDTESEVSQTGAITTENTSEPSTETTVIDKITTFKISGSETVSSLEERLVETTVTISPQVTTDKLTHHVTNMTPKVTETSSTHFTSENASRSTELDTLSETLSTSASVSSIKETQIKTKPSPTKVPLEVAQTTSYSTTKVNDITKTPETVTPDNEGAHVKFDGLSTILTSKVTESSHLSSTTTNDYSSTVAEVVTETYESDKNKTSILLEFETKTMESTTAHPLKTQNASTPLTSDVTSGATQKEMSTAESHAKIHVITSKDQTEITEAPKLIYTSTTTKILSEETQNHSASTDTSIQSETIRWPTTLTVQRIKTVPSSLNIKHEDTAEAETMLFPKTTTVFSTYFPSHLTELSPVSQDAGNEFISLTESSINEIASINDLKSLSTITLDKDLITETTGDPFQFEITQNVTSDSDIMTTLSQTTQKANTDEVSDSKAQYTTTVIPDLIDSSSLNRTIDESHVPETLLMTQVITERSPFEGSESDSGLTDKESHIPETLIMTQVITERSPFEGLESDSGLTAKDTQSSTFSEISAVTTDMLAEESSLASTLKLDNDIFGNEILGLTSDFEENKSTEDPYRHSETPSTALQSENTESTSYYTEDKRPSSTDITSTKIIQSENTLKDVADGITLLPVEISSISDESTNTLTDRKTSTETTESIQSTKKDSVTENVSVQTTKVAAHPLNTQNASIHIVPEITSGPFDSTQIITTDHKTDSNDDESITPVEKFTFSPTTKIIQPVDAKSVAHPKASSVIPTETYDSSSSDVPLSTTLHSFSDSTYTTKYVDTDTSTIISHAETKESTSIPIHFSTTYTQPITALTNETFEYTRNISVDKQDDDENLLIPNKLSVEKEDYFVSSTVHSYQKSSVSDATVKPLHSTQITDFAIENASETESDMSFTISSTETTEEIIDSSTVYTETKTPSDILITNFPDDMAESISWSEKPKTTFAESVTQKLRETTEYIYDVSVLTKKGTEVSPTVSPTIIEGSAFILPKHEKSTTLKTPETTEVSYASSSIEHEHESTEKELSTEKPSTTDYYPSIQDQRNTSEIDPSLSSISITTSASTLSDTYTSLQNDTSVEFPIHSETDVFEATDKSTKSPIDSEAHSSETTDKSTETKSEEILNAHDIVLSNLTMLEYLSNFTISTFTESDNNQKELFTETSQSIKETIDTFGTKSEEVTFKPSDITFKYVTTTASHFPSVQDFTYENTNSVPDDTEEAKTVTDVSELETHTSETNVASIEMFTSVSPENNQSRNEYGSNDVFDIPTEIHSDTPKINITLNVEEDKTYNISTSNILPSTSAPFAKNTTELFSEEEYTKGSINHELHDNSKDEIVTDKISTKIFDIGVSVTTEHEKSTKISIDDLHGTLITSEESEVTTQVGSKFSTMGSDVTLPPNNSTFEDSEILPSKFSDEVTVSENPIHDYLSTTAHSSPDSILTLKLTTLPPQDSTLLDNKFDTSHLKTNETQAIEIISPENILFNFTTKYDEKKFNASSAQEEYLRPIPDEVVITTSTTLSNQHGYIRPIPNEGVVPDTTSKDFLGELGSSDETTYTISQTTIHIPISTLYESEDALSNIKQTFFPLRNNTALKVPDPTHQFVLGHSRPITSTNTDIVQHVESKYPGESSPSPGWVAHSLHEDLVKKLSTVFPSSPATIVHEIHNLPSTTVSGESFTQSQEDDGVCYFEGGVYLSSEQIPRTDTCEFCFCFKGDIICLQQTCPPPIKGCYAIPIEGFCCPRFHCPVKQTWFNVSAATTTTTTVPFGHVSHKTHSTPGCQIEGKSYLLHQVVQASSNPCMLCRCDYGGIMKCDPRSCKPDAPMIEEIAEAYSKKRR